MQDWAVAFALVGVVAAMASCEAIRTRSNDSMNERLALACMERGGFWQRADWSAEYECARSEETN